MAHSLSSKKRIRQNAKRRDRNRARASALKSQLRRARTALSGGDANAASEAVAASVRLLDRLSTKGTIHPNAAARRKSKLARKLNALKAGAK